MLREPACEHGLSCPASVRTLCGLPLYRGSSTLAAAGACVSKAEQQRSGVSVETRGGEVRPGRGGVEVWTGEGRCGQGRGGVDSGERLE